MSADLNLIIPNIFSGGTAAVAREVNENFSAIKQYAVQVSEAFSEIQESLNDLKQNTGHGIFDVFYSASSKAPAGAYPLWTGETITHCKTLFPEFWQEAVSRKQTGQIKTVDSDNEYEEILSEYGQCGKFFIDELNGHIRLPKIVKFVSSVSDAADLGALYNDQNKEHSHILKVSSNNGYIRPDANSYMGGATYASGSTREFWSQVFDVQNTASISADGGEEAWPKHIRLPLFIQVANNSIAISNMDTNVIAEQLAEAQDSLWALEKNLEEQLKKYAGQVSGLMYEEINIVLAHNSWSEEKRQTIQNEAIIQGRKMDMGLPVPTNKENMQAVSSSGLFISETQNGAVTFETENIPEQDITITLRLWSI